jgi:hypothetical protein
MAEIKKSGKYLRYLILIGVILVVSCNMNRESQNANTSNDSLASLVKDNAALESVYYRFPTPNEVFGFISNEKLRFDPLILIPVDQADKFLETKSQTIGLGIYISDLAYITMFEAYNKSIEYYKIIHSLSEKIRITSAYDLEVAKRIEKNLLKLDSLKRISTDSYSSMVEYLIVNNREKTLALIAAGAYVECFYIAFNMAGQYTDNNPMIIKIVDLKYAFDNLYSYIQIYSDDESVKSLSIQLAALKSLFDKMKEENLGKTTVKQDASGNLILGGGTKLKVDNALFQELKSEIFRLRAEMISTN